MLLCYFSAPKAWKNAVLFLFSLLFYAWGEPVYVVLMIFSTVLDYTCSYMVDKYRGTPKARLGLLVSVFVNLWLLLFFKYADFFIETLNGIFHSELPLLNLPLPIGISFYTFQTMSYTIDVYREAAKVQKNIISFAAYVSLFPQLIAGPIVRYQDIADQLSERTHSFDKFGDGVKRFAAGLGKKVLLANNIGLLWSGISTAPNMTVIGAWLGIFAFGFQIYFDFSGYSDMAIGLGKMFGFELLENFSYPYISQSITEFWRRWHMSLGIWFRDYVYIPLGGNQKGLPVQIRNTAIVWLLTGLWHGASWNFILWGALYGLLLMIEKLFLLKWLKKAPAFIGHCYTLFFVLMGWVLFAFDDLSAGISCYGAMFGRNAVFINGQTIYQLLSYFPMLLICVLASTPLAKSLYEKACAKYGVIMVTADHVGIVSLLLLSMSYLIGGSYNPFLYFRF